MFLSYYFVINFQVIYHKLKKYLNFRSSHQSCSIEKAVLKNFTIFTGKHQCWSLLLTDLRASRPATLFKRDSNTVFSCEYWKILFWSKSANNCFCSSCFLLLVFVLGYLVLLLIQLNNQRSSSRFKEFSLGCLVVGSSLIWKKEKLAEMVTRCRSLSLVVTRYHSLSLVVTLYHSLSLVVTRCHSLSLVVPLVVIRCRSLPFVATRFITRCHSLSLDVPLVCLFINDQKRM